MPWHRRAQDNKSDIEIAWGKRYKSCRSSRILDQHLPLYQTNNPLLLTPTAMDSFQWIASFVVAEKKEEEIESVVTIDEAGGGSTGTGCVVA